MLEWMMGIVGMTAILCAAAFFAERAARAVRAPTRWIWALAILGSLLLPAAMRILSAEWMNLSAMILAHRAAPIGTTAQLDLLQLSQSLRGTPVTDTWQRYDTFLLYAWIAFSVILATALVVSHATWLRRRRTWTKGNLHQSSVYFAPNWGPAVMGFISPTIVVPMWLKQSPPAQKAFVLAHETSHIEAYDPQLLTAALALVILVPWNMPLWWQLKRLRKAVEIDCDARVLSAGHDATCYGETLLAIGQRQSRIIGTAIAMSESPSFLEERIAIMINKPVRSARMIAVGFAGLSLAVAALAIQVAPRSGSPPAGTQAATGVGQAVLVKLTPSALEAFVGHYKAADNAVLAVTRENDHLNVQFSGEREADAVFPEGSTRFVYANTKFDAKIEFQTDAQGRPIAAVLLQNGARNTMPRIDTGSAQQIEAARFARLQSQTPAAASEAAVRHFIDGIQSGHPDLDKLSPQLAGQVAKDLPKLHLTLAPLGSLKSLIFRSMDAGGFDVFEAKHEQGSSEWRVDVDGQGVITGAMFPVVTAD
jgi:bla regulator protein BlaR1